MKPTLGQVFTGSLLGLAAVLGVLFYLVLDASRRTILESSERIRAGASREIGERVTGFLAKAPEAVQQVQLALDHGLIAAHDPAALEPALFAVLLANRELSEITLTYGTKTGFAEGGAIQLADHARGQWSVGRRSQASSEALWSRHVHEENGRFVADRRELALASRFTDLPVQREPAAELPDPTAHLTFTTPASQEFYGQLLWSDLHFSQIDDDLPEAQRRVEVSVQQAVTDAGKEFVGVLRVGLLAQQLDHVVQLMMSTGAESDPHLVFLCDRDGRLITRGVPTDRWEESGDDLRIAPGVLAEPLKSALAEPRLRAVDEEAPVLSGMITLGRVDYLTTFRLLPGTQEWLAGVVVPRSFYLGNLTAMRDRLLVFSLAISAFLVAGGVLILRSVKRAQAQISRESLKMNAFEFSPAPTEAPFRDVSEVLESLEKAKTAMRAMGKYAPVDLVRRLYREKREPELGGELMEISIMFTDIKGFTTLAEYLPPDDLAEALGRYLDAMVRIIQQAARGTIDKFIGDAIMTIWNAPEPVAEHARLACEAALRCREVGAALAQSPEWRGLPPFETRFGLHCGRALVGHFGAPDRMNYTAIGDAVNLASRLESLNKQYGTSIIVTESIEERTRAYFRFRTLDLVAVKGKSAAIKIYELLGSRNESDVPDEAILTYEIAFAAYTARDFDGAIALLTSQTSDPPSRVLLARCRAYLEEPPAADWAGVHLAATK